MASTDAATHARLRRQAQQSVEDPLALAKAVRIVNAAIEREVAGWPPLTQRQRDTLAGLLRGPAPADEAP